MSFTDPIVGGIGKLVRNFIRSQNYVPGSTGWTINKDGTAEFQGATIGGTVVIASTHALLIYDGAPALNKLIFSLAGTAGVDSFGNTYPAGIGLSVTLASGPGSLKWAINQLSPLGQIYLDSNHQLNMQGTDSFVALDGAIPVIQLLTPGNIQLGNLSTGFNREQHGKFNAVFAGGASVAGTLVFPQPFTLAPLLVHGVQVGSNLDIGLNWQTVTATQATWRAYQNTGAGVTGTAIIHWWGVA